MVVKNIRNLGPKIMSSKKITMIMTGIIVVVVFLITIFVIPAPRPVYSLFFDHGINISHNVKLSLSPPHIVTYGNNVYVVWGSHSARSSDIYFKTIRVGGTTTFGSTLNLSHNPNGNFSGSPQISAYRNNVYVVWEHDTNGNRDIYFKASKNSGTNFASEDDLSKNVTGNAHFPNMAALQNNVYVVWEHDTNGNRDIYFKASKNNGTTFGSTLNLSHNPNGNFSGSPQISAYRNNVYVVWEHDTNGNRDIYFKASKNNGTTFGSTLNLSHNKKGISGSSSPRIFVSSNNVYVVWERIAAQSSDIYFKPSKNSGTTFGSTLNLSHNPNGNFSGSPQISAYGNNVYVVWGSHSARSSDIYFKTIRVGGATTFGSTLNLSHNPNGNFSGSPEIAVSVHHIYMATIDNITGNSDVYFRHIKWSLIT
jgi:hypothetical protein